MMESIKYLHAADLHLDAVCKGSASRFGNGSAHNASEATFTALERLVKLAGREKPDFVVLAGDIYNEEDHSIKAQLALRNACRRLHELSMPVYIASGNHDPASSRHSALEWPENVVFFGENIESIPFLKNDRKAAIIHGISHFQNNEGRNLAKLFRRDPDASCFQLGVLHCSVGSGPKDRYAPCSLDDLIESGLDAWALGHAHVRQVLSEKPFIAYSGNTQGLHINESGPRGCFIVTASPRDGSFDCDAKFCQLGPVQWETIDVDVSGAESLDEVVRRLERAIVSFCETLPPESVTLVVRPRLFGSTDLDDALRDSKTLEAIEGELNYLKNRIPSICIKDFSIETGRLPDLGNLLSRDDLAGEVARICEKIASSSENLEEFAKKTLSPLFDAPRLRGILAMPTGENLAALFEDAKRTGLEKLEKS